MTETRGKSRVNPTEYKKDIVVQTWAESRDVATLVKWMDQENEHPRSMSYW
jgi:hypothetical protein